MPGGEQVVGDLGRGGQGGRGYGSAGPHSGVGAAAANVALGPVAALMGRTKDAVREAMGGGKS